MGALALVAGALVPVLVVTAAPHAQAVTTTTTAATVGARAAAPATVALCTAGGPVTAAVCIGGAAAMIGFGLYLTRDTWMPWVGLGGGESSQTLRPTAFMVISWNPPPVAPASDGFWPVGIRGVKSGGELLYSSDTTVIVQYVCQSTAGAITAGQTGGQAFSQNTFATYTTDRAFSTCGPGQTLLQAVAIPTGGSIANSLVWTNPAAATNAGANATAEQRAAADAAAELVQFRVEADCRLANGTVATVVTTSSKAPIFPSCSERYGAGAVADTLRIYSGYSQTGITNRPFETITNRTGTLYPDCAGGVCTLQVYYRGNPCQEGATRCVAWSRLALEEPSDYTCRYGPYTLPITQCNPLERYYEVGGRTLPATGPNVDGDWETVSPPRSLDPGIGTPVRPIIIPNPTTNPTPNPTTSPTPNPTGTPSPTPTYTLPPFFNPEPNPDAAPGAPRPNPTSNPDGSPNTQPDPYTYPDPNGVPNPNPNPTVNPDGSPRTDPGPGTGPGGAPAPGAAPGPGGNPLDNPANSSCWPNGWGWFNPAEWVLRPIACAFIPRASTQARMSDLAAQLRQKPPYTVAAGTFGVLASLDGQGSQCWVQTTALPGIGDGRTITVLDTCTPGPIEGALMQYRAVLLAAIWIAVLSPLGWWFWREYAPGSKGVA